MAGERFQLRKRVFALLADPVCALDPAASTDEYRAQVLKCCEFLARNGLGLLAFPTEYGGGGRIADSIAAFETIAFHDLSLLVKFGVQFGLFGGSVLQLGTAQHHQRYLRAIGTLELPGCFAMTESAHGSNVRDIETTARYDPATREFVVHTPNRAARKDYIGNAALHGRMATVFAQLEVNGEGQGVHAFLVPIRDQSGRELAGVAIEDCGLKAGLNGVDNGRISFSSVRIPRSNMLNRFADVSAEGVYTSPIPSSARRFFTMLGTLVAGRMSIACCVCQRGQTGADHRHTIRGPAPAVRAGRRCGSADPHLPVYAAHSAAAAGHDVRTRCRAPCADHPLCQGRQRRPPGRHRAARNGSVGSIAQGLRILARARCSCSRRGKPAAAPATCSDSRLGTLREDVDIFATFEGANVVLQQLVAKGLLSDYREQFGELRVWTVIKFVTARASTAVTEQNPIIKRKTDREHLRDPEFHEAALRFREQRLLSSVARRLKAQLDDGVDSFAAMNACQTHLLSLAHAHAERVTLESFHVRIKRCEDESVRGLLEQLAALFALAALERDRAWFLESDYVEVGKSKAIRREVIDLCAELTPYALTLIDGFGIPDALVGAPGETEGG